MGNVGEAAVLLDYRRQFLTGLLYIDEKRKDFRETMQLVDEPLVNLGQDKLRPAKEALDKIMASLM